MAVQWESDRRETIRRQGVALIQLLRNKDVSPQHQKAFNDLMDELPHQDPALNHRANDGRTPLTTAAAEGNLDQLRRLLGAGASVNTVDRDGWTALHHAVHRLDEDLVRCLLGAGADVTARVPQKGLPQGRNALHLLVARASGFAFNVAVPDVAIATVLKNAGCDPWQPDKMGHTPLQTLQRQKTCTRPALLGWFETLALNRALDTVPDADQRSAPRARL